MVVALVALFVALTGSAVAVQSAKKVKIPKNSVGTKQLKSGAVGTRQLKSGAVQSSILADGAVQTNNIANSAITESELSDGIIGASKIQPGAINTTLFSAGNPTVTVRDSDGYSMSTASGLTPSIGTPTFDVEDVDTTNMFPSLVPGATGGNMLAVRTSGVYTISFTATFADSGGAGKRQIYVRVREQGVLNPGNPKVAALLTVPDGSGTQTATGTVSLEDGDVIEALTFANLANGQSTSVTGSPIAPTLTATWVSAAGT